VRVEVVDLHGEAPVVMRDSVHSLVIGIDFNCPPEKIAAGLQGFMEEGIVTGRWHRRGACDRHHEDRRAALHPESGPY
jgi:hypothetical protein